MQGRDAVKRQDGKAQYALAAGVRLCEKVGQLFVIGRRQITASRQVPRARVRRPFNAWLRSPELADRLQKVGEYVRFNTSLDKRLNEMAIIMTAQFWGSQYEWFAHAPLAAKAGLSSDIIAELKAGQRPSKMAEDEAVVYDFVNELTTTQKVSDETYARAKKVFNDQQIVDLTAVAGNYVMVAMVLAMAEETVPPGREPPFKVGEK